MEGFPGFWGFSQGCCSSWDLGGFFPGKSGKSSFKGREKFKRILPKIPDFAQVLGKLGNKSRGILAFQSLILEETVRKSGNLGEKNGGGMGFKHELLPWIPIQVFPWIKSPTFGNEVEKVGMNPRNSLQHQTLPLLFPNLDFPDPNPWKCLRSS